MKWWQVIRFLNLSRVPSKLDLTTADETEKIIKKWKNSFLSLTVSRLFDKRVFSAIDNTRH